MAVKVKCIYDKPAAADGYRVLVMRWWPRGVRKDKVDDWQKELGTSPELIKAWKGGRIKWAEFARRYRDEMRGCLCKIADLADLARRRTVTLLCGCRDGDHCHRTLLKQLVDKAVLGPQGKAAAPRRKSPPRRKK
jgi:uncharacterized protein YeaO (DUF488 family)